MIKQMEAGAHLFFAVTLIVFSLLLIKNMIVEIRNKNYKFLFYSILVNVVYYVIIVVVVVTVVLGLGKISEKIKGFETNNEEVVWIRKILTR